MIPVFRILYNISKMLDKITEFFRFLLMLLKLSPANVAANGFVVFRDGQIPWEGMVSIDSALVVCLPILPSSL
jgi:hypothetical protein